jgi:hypothetical protein
MSFLRDLNIALPSLSRVRVKIATFHSRKPFSLHQFFHWSDGTAAPHRAFD